MFAARVATALSLRLRGLDGTNPNGRTLDRHYVPKLNGVSEINNTSETLILLIPQSKNNAPIGPDMSPKLLATVVLQLGVLRLSTKALWPATLKGAHAKKDNIETLS